MQLKLSRDNSEVDLHISTISLTNDYEKRVNLFRCIYCGTAISQYEGIVIKIKPIVEPMEELLVISKCHGCGALYTFHTQMYSQKPPTKVELFIDPLLTQQTFYCFICRRPLLKYNFDHVVDLKGMKEVFLPYIMKCPTFDCLASYKFTDVV